MTDKIKKGDIIEGSVIKGLDRRFLSSLDFLGFEPVEFTIDRVEKVDELVYGNGTREKNVRLVYFKETEKPLKFNITNIKLAAIKFKSIKGKDWINKKLKLGVKMEKNFGKLAPCLRVVG